jgi:UDP-N-acetylglucosamine--N-acetylmuramyl-(pentapeptide) pyrophosphoryl-undecaprenol N-acetylglucosamine transferase
MKRVLIAGGGTGGHISPALAVGRAIEADGWAEVFYARTERPVDEAMYRGQGSKVHLLRSPRIDRGAVVFLPFTGTVALAKAAGLLRKLGIDAVLGTGGYASFYCVAAAWLLGIPGAVLDTNAFPGRSNRLVSRFCKVAFAAFPGQDRLFHCPVSTVGIPREPVRVVSGAAEKLGLPEEKPVVLVLGGSQGARALNDLALQCPGGISVLLQCGGRDEQRVAEIAKDRENFLVAGFLEDLSDWYSASDIAVARAGAQTLAELASFGVPAVFIPYPHAADDHQARNAGVAVEAGGALMVRQETLNPGSFWEAVTELLQDREKLASMSAAMERLLPADTAERISTEIRGLCL